MRSIERSSECGATIGASRPALRECKSLNRQIPQPPSLEPPSLEPPSLEPPSLGTTEGLRAPVCFGPIRSVTYDFIQPPNASSRECASAICASGLCVMVMNHTRLKNSDHAVFQ